MLLRARAAATAGQALSKHLTSMMHSTLCSSTSSSSAAARPLQPLARHLQQQSIATAFNNSSRAAYTCSSALFGPNTNQTQQEHVPQLPRHVARSVAAKAPTIKHQWDSETAKQVLASLANEPTEFAKGLEVLDSIVKIYTVFSRPDYFLPWQNHPKRESTGTGFVIRDRLIMTNAHVVADQTYVTVKRHGSSTKFTADVVAVGHDVDLALLTVEDEEFWVGTEGPMKPLKLGGVPQLQEQVSVIGYPTGGDNTSITSGVVSRVEVTLYVHAASHLMAAQIDAAINPGNSGGPALSQREDVVVGVAFQNVPNADNIGYIIPLPVVQRFMSEVLKYGRYRGFTSLGIVFQTMDNTHLRRALGMGPHQTGVLINRIQPTTSTAQVLQKGDVLMEFDGIPIANDGTVPFRARERIFFTAFTTLKPTGSTAKVKVLRSGQELEYEIEMQPLQTLVPVHKYDQLPSYFIYAGLVFVPLSQPYLHEYGDNWQLSSPRRLVDKALNDLMDKPSQQIIVMSQVLVDDINTGYQQFQNLQVLRVNGVEVLNLAHLKHLIMGKGSRAPSSAAVEPPAEPTAAEAAVTAAAAEAAAANNAADASPSTSGSGSNGQAGDAPSSSNNNNGSSSEIGGNVDTASTSMASSSSSSDTPSGSASSSNTSSIDESMLGEDGELKVGTAAWDAKYIQIELEDDRQIIMERAAASEATERLQRRYRVPYLCSADLAD